MKSLLVFLSILILVSTPAIAAEKYGGGPQAIDGDPSSTFELGNLTSVFPLDTVLVPLTFTTSNLVTYIENRVNWTAADLTLLDVIPGDGIADTVAFDIINQTSDEVSFKFTVTGDPVAVGSEPIANLVFEVQCYGYGALTNVTFADDNNYNFYVSGGIPAAPVRDNGTVRTQSESLTLMWSQNVSAYTAQQDIPWTTTFYQSVPGKVNSVTLQYDYTAMRVDSVTALAGLEGGTASIIFNLGGYLIVGIASPILPPVQADLFEVHFAMLDDRDDFSTAVSFLYVERVNACGDTIPPTAWGSNITIPNHTASGDLGNISKYPSATYYDLPVVMDSNHPINAFELRVSFPADEIYFDGIVGRAGFTPPSGSVDPGDTTVVNLNNGSGTDYDPADLPTTVFYMRFRPWSPPSAGDYFDLAFVDPHPENEIQYWTDLGAFHDADITALDPGRISIVSPPGGGGGDPCCPALYVWNGSGYQLDNTILAECDGKNVESHVTDYYRLTQPAVADADVLRFQIREDANAVSEFGDFELLVVDHPADEDIHVTRGGEIVTMNAPFAIEWARDHTGRDITNLISSHDNVVYKCRTDGWFDVSLGTLSSDQVGKFAAGTHDALAKRKDCEELLADGIEVGRSRKLSISVRNPDGTWRLISENDARHNPTRQTALITPEMIADGEEVVLRYAWQSYYQIDALEFNASVPFAGDVVSVPRIDASRVGDGVVAPRLGPAPGEVLTLTPGEVIDVVFDASGLERTAAGHVREYVFVATGKYSEPGAQMAAEHHSFRLDANVPNPFNPTTTIGYSLETATNVHLAVYDVRGALVRTLVSGRQSAGDKSVVWDGSSNSGTAMASGVYFYRLSTPEFVQTRKMILLK